MESIDHKNVHWTAWDVGGRDKMVSSYIGSILTHMHAPTFSIKQRPLLRHYYQNTDVLIYVIDSNDRERISECQDELQRLLREDELRDSILLVLANKQDLPNAMSVREITEKLGLNALKDRLWCKCTHVDYSRT